MRNKKRDYNKPSSFVHKTGVFKVPSGWIVRVYLNGVKTTVSRHKTEEEAILIYNQYDK